MKYLVFSTILVGGVLIGGAWSWRTYHGETGWDWLTRHGFGFWGFLGLVWLGLCLIGGVALVLDSVSQRWKRRNIHSNEMARANHNDKLPIAWIATRKFEAAEIDIPEWLASRDEWVRYAEEVYPILRVALTMCGKDDKGVTSMCAQEPEAMVEALQATRDALGKYRQLVDLLATARARMLVGLERAVGEAA